MLFIIGISWLVDWLLIAVFALNGVKAALVTGIIFLVVGLLIDYAPKYYHRP